jgi:TonB family protein
MERGLLEYMVNSLWQAPLLALGAWLVLRAGRPGPRVQHGIWVGVLASMVGMPMLSLRSVSVPVEAASNRTAGMPGAGIKDGAGAVAAGPVGWRRSMGPPRRMPGHVGSRSREYAHDDPIDGAAASGGDVETKAEAGDAKPGYLRRPMDWLQMREVRLSAAATHRVVELYLAVIALAVLRLLWSWAVARRMVADAQPAELSEAEQALFESCCERLQVRPPRVLVSARTASPLVVGVLRPALLLPAGFVGNADAGERTGEPATQKYGSMHSGRELEAVWWHELAHVSRRDYLANLACRIWTLPVAYHPVTYVVERRVRQTREMVCDRMAAREMRSPLVYARCLLGLVQRMQAGLTMAEQMRSAGLGIDLLGNGVLEERVMELIETRPVMSMRARALRLAGTGAMLLGLLGAAATFRVTPTMAKAVGGKTAQAVAPAVVASSPGMGVAEAPATVPPQAPAEQSMARGALGIAGQVSGTGQAFPSRVTYVRVEPNGRGLGVEMSSDRAGVDLTPYLSSVAETMQRNWDRPLAPGIGRTGKAAMRFSFTIHPDGSVDAVKPDVSMISASALLPLIDVARSAIAPDIRFAAPPPALRDGNVHVLATLTFNMTLEEEKAFGTMVAVEANPAAPMVDGRSVSPTPEEVTEILNRNEAIYGLNTEQRMTYRGVMAKYEDLALDRRRLVAQEFRELRAMPEAKRQETLGSVRYRTQFDDEERAVLAGLLSVEQRLPVKNAGKASAGGVSLRPASYQAAGASSQPAAPAKGRMLAAGDRMRIAVIELQSFSEQPYRIDASGELDLPLVGKMQVAGKTVQQVMADLTVRLHKFVMTPHVAVNLLDERGQMVLAGPGPAGLVKGVLVFAPGPDYPAGAVAARVAGTVVVEGVIAKDGGMAALKVVGGPQPLRQSALDAVRQWKWKPYLVDGAPVDQDTRVGITFSMAGVLIAPEPKALDEVLVVDAPEAARASVKPASYQAETKPVAPEAKVLCTPQVFGNRRIPTEDVLSHLASKQGERYDLATVKRDMDMLWATGFFSKVRFERADTPKCLQIEVHVQETGQEVVQEEAPKEPNRVIMQARVSPAAVELPGAPKATFEPGFEILSNTLGCEELLGYISRMYDDLKRNWGPLVPASAQAPGLKKGVVGIKLTILPDGSLEGPIRLENSSGDAALDKAAWFAITSEGKFPPLPKEFLGPNVVLRVGFFYNTHIPEGREGGEPREDKAAGIPASFGQRAARAASYKKGERAAAQTGGGQTAPASGGPERVPSGTMQGLLMAHPGPVYPLVARAANVQGAVVMEAVISEDGTVKDVKATDGPLMLRSSALAAVKQWRYKPYLLNGAPTEVETTIKVNFTFSGDGIAAWEHHTDRELYDSALAQSRAGFYAAARLGLRSLLVAYPDSRFVMASRLAIADSWFLEGTPSAFAQATEEYKSFLAFYPDAPEAAKARARLVEIAAGLRKIGRGVAPPVLIYQVNPEYTEQARQNEATGLVSVSLSVNEQGNPTDVHVVRGVGSGLDEKAIEAVKQYRFRPAMEMGKPVTVAINVNVNFQLF